MTTKPGFEVSGQPEALRTKSALKNQSAPLSMLGSQRVEFGTAHFVRFLNSQESLKKVMSNDQTEFLRNSLNLDLT